MSRTRRSQKTIAASFAFHQFAHRRQKRDLCGTPRHKRRRRSPPGPSSEPRSPPGALPAHLLELRRHGAEGPAAQPGTARPPPAPRGPSLPLRSLLPARSSPREPSGSLRARSRAGVEDERSGAEPPGPPGGAPTPHAALPRAGPGSRGPATPVGSGQSSAAPEGSGAASLRARCRRAGEEGGGGPRSLPAPAGGSVLPRSGDKRGKMKCHPAGPGRGGEGDPSRGAARKGREGKGRAGGGSGTWGTCGSSGPAPLQQRRGRTGGGHSLLPSRSSSATGRVRLKLQPPYLCIF